MTTRLNFLKQADVFLLMLVGADIFFIVLHILFRLQVFPSLLGDPNFSIQRDLGLAEAFQYLKEYWTAGILAWLFIRTKQPLYLMLSILFAYLLLDDMLKIHEQVGLQIANSFGYADTSSLRARDLGELTMFAVLGGVFVVLLGISYRFSSQDCRTNARRMFLMLAFFSFFGGIVDVVHSVAVSQLSFQGLGLVEDAGEMLIMSFMCWYALLLARGTRSRASTTIVEQRGEII